MRTLTEAFAPGAPSLPEGLRTLVVSPDRSVEPGTTVRATFAFYNFGGAAATGLRVRFALPDGLRYVPGSARVDDHPLDDLRGETGLLAPNGVDVGEVPPGVERRIALAYVVAPTIENAAILEIQAALVANETEVIGSNIVRLVAQSAPKLENRDTVAAIAAVRLAEPGEEIVATARVRNSGHATAHDIVVVLPVPDWTTYIPGSARIDGREVAIDERGGDPFGFGNATIASTALAAGGTLVVEYRARIATPLDDNTRIALGGAVASTETAEFELARAELVVHSASRFDSDATRLVVDAPGEVEPGRRIRIALIAENAGTCAADDVRLRTTLPDGVRYAPGSRSLDGRSVGENEDAGSFVVPRIEAGRRVEASIDAYVVSPAVDGTSLRIAGSLQWATGSRTFERTLTVRSAPRFLESRNTLALDGATQVTPRTELRATIRIANDGTAQASGVRIVIDADPALQLLRYGDGSGAEARVQGSGIDVGTLAPGAARTFTLAGTVASPIADRFAIRLRARLENDQTPAVALGQIEATVRSRPRFVPATSTIEYASGEPLRPSGQGDVHIVVVNDGTDVARDVRLQLDVTDAARIEAVDGATRVGTALLFGDVAPGVRTEATVRLRLARLVPRGTAITVNGRLEAVGLLPFALAPVTIPTTAEPRFDDGAALHMQPGETVDAGEALYVRLTVRNTGDGAASRLVVRAHAPAHTTYLPGSTAVNDVPLLDVDGGSILFAKAGLVLEDVDPGIEVSVRYCAIVSTPLAAGTLLESHADLTWDGGATLAVSSAPVRVRSTPAFAVRAHGLPFSVSGIAPRTIDVLNDIGEQRRARTLSPSPPLTALPPPPFAAPPQADAPQSDARPAGERRASPERAAYRVGEEAIEARFRHDPPDADDVGDDVARDAPPEAHTEANAAAPDTAPAEAGVGAHEPDAPLPSAQAAADSPAEPPEGAAVSTPSSRAPVDEAPAMPDADVAAGAVAALPGEPEHVDEVALAQSHAAAGERSTAGANVAAPLAQPEAAADDSHRAASGVGPRLRLTLARDALERALAYLEQSDYGGLVTHIFAIRTLFPTSVGAGGDVAAALAAHREAMQGVINRLFIKMRMPRYALTGKDLEDRASRTTVVELVNAVRSAGRADIAFAPDAAVVIEGTAEMNDVVAELAALESEPLGSARPWLVLAHFLPTAFVLPAGGGEVLADYRTALIEALANVAALPHDEFHRVLAGTHNTALDNALRDVRAALRDALEASAANV